MPFKDGKRKKSYGYPMMEDDTPMTKKKPAPAKPKPKPAKPKAYTAQKGAEVTKSTKGKDFASKIPFEGASGYSVGKSEGPAKGTQVSGPNKAKAGKAGSPGRKTYTDVAGFLNIHKS